MEVAALVVSDDGEVPPPWSLLWGFWWGLWGLRLVLAAACLLRLSPWGFSAWMLTWRGLGAPRGDVFCGWVSPGGGLRILGLWLMRGRLCRWARFWGLASACFWRALRGAVEVGLLLLVVFVLLGGKAEWSPRRVDGLAVRLGFVGVQESLGSVVRYGAGRTAWGWRLCLGLGL